MVKLRHEVWEHSLGSEFCLASKDHAELREKLDPEAELVHVIYASSYLEAQTLYHEWRGWSPYSPLPDFDYQAYTAEDAERQRREGFTQGQRPLPSPLRGGAGGGGASSEAPIGVRRTIRRLTADTPTPNPLPARGRGLQL